MGISERSRLNENTDYPGYNHVPSNPGFGAPGFGAICQRMKRRKRARPHLPCMRWQTVLIFHGLAMKDSAGEKGVRKMKKPAR
jgi:hypothetical protein